MDRRTDDRRSEKLFSSGELLKTLKGDKLKFEQNVNYLFTFIFSLFLIKKTQTQWQNKKVVSNISNGSAL